MRISLGGAFLIFQVLECLWDELLTKVKEAKDLDYIIAAHEVFLNAINVRCLLDKDSMVSIRIQSLLYIAMDAAQSVDILKDLPSLNSDWDFLVLTSRMKKNFNQILKSFTLNCEFLLIISINL